MMQPISSNPYLVQQQTSYIPMSQPVQPSYNAVKIDVHNPSVNTPGAQPQMVPAPQAQPMYQPQYAPVTNPYYSYPQAQLYDYPQAPQGMQPCYMPQNMICQPAQAVQPAQPPVTYPQVMPTDMSQVQEAVLVNALARAAAAEQIAAATINAMAPEIQQMNINAPQAVKAPEPVVTTTPAQPSVAPAQVQAPAQAPAPEVVPPTPITPQVDLNAFITRLTNPDYEVQAAAMEEIANMVKDQPQKATELLDEKVITVLSDIIKADSSKLAGPSAEQIAARQKMLAGQQLTEAEQTLANTITPMEQAERNKSYAMFTTAIMQKLYADEVQKLANTTVPLTELPGAVNIVEQLKDNPNPMVRTSAIESLSYIGQPAYKQDLKTIFEIAQNDQDANVQEAAKIALEKLNAMTEPQKVAA